MSVYSDVRAAMVCGRTSLKDKSAPTDWPARRVHQILAFVPYPDSTTISPFCGIEPPRKKLIVNRRTVNGLSAEYLLIKICKCNNNEVLHSRYAIDSYELQYSLSRKILAGKLREMRATMRSMMSDHEAPR